MSGSASAEAARAAPGQYPLTGRGVNRTARGQAILVFHDKGAVSVLAPNGKLLGAVAGLPRFTYGIAYDKSRKLLYTAYSDVYESPNYGLCAIDPD